jgi:serine/threonine protein kinase
VAVKCTLKESIKKFKGTVGYAPPEAIESHNHKLDIWSWGCTLHEMILGKLPFAYSNWKELSTLITEEYLHKHSFNSSLPVELLHLFKKIFVYDKDLRPSIEEVMSHPFFTGEPLILGL